MKRSMKAMLVALALPLAGCGGSNTTGSYGGATPEAAFSNFTSAMKSKDYKTAFAQTTPETQEMMLSIVAPMASMVAAFDPASGGDIKKILDKHGIKEFDPSRVGPNQDPKAAMKDLTANVTDKPACLAEIMAWMESKSPN